MVFPAKTFPPTPFYQFSCFALPSVNQQRRSNIYRNPYNHPHKTRTHNTKIDKTLWEECFFFQQKHSPHAVLSSFWLHPRKHRTSNTKMDKTLWRECLYWFFQQKQSPHTVLSIFLLRISLSKSASGLVQLSLGGSRGRTTAPWAVVKILT